MATIRVQPEPFDVGREIAQLSADRTDIGGLGCFVGLVRGSAGDDALDALTLEHYPGMTERALASIAATAEDRWSLLGCTLIHRIGRLAPGEPI
ncbi:MAG: molybdenum cofactor biosynthesis protein MoaE, partial [Janthinobacterium lividum]